MAEAYQQIIDKIDFGDHANMGQEGHGPVILTEKTALALRPPEADIKLCQISTAELLLCQTMSFLSLNNLPKNIANSKYPLNDDADKARRAGNLVQRACPVYQHSKNRDQLPCSGTIKQLKSFLILRKRKKN